VGGVAEIRDYLIGLGANLGDRQATLEGAVGALERLGAVRGLSHLYENPAVGGPRQPDYLNAAARLRSELEPAELLQKLLRIEQRFGRVRTVPWGPRTLDLDLLWADRTCIRSHKLHLPHPRLTERAFALVPLVQVAPAATDPTDHVPYWTKLAMLETSELTIVGTASGLPHRWIPAGKPRSAGNPALAPV
jgi:2-amino-4-hydroxy-6-hydroxymethyldihydropteridine diphosphokinase